MNDHSMKSQESINTKIKLLNASEISQAQMLYKKTLTLTQINFKPLNNKL